MTDENAETVALLRELVDLAKQELELTKGIVERGEHRAERSIQSIKSFRYTIIAIAVAILLGSLALSYFRG